MRKINDTMNRLAVTAYVKGGRNSQGADCLPGNRQAGPVKTEVNNAENS